MFLPVADSSQTLSTVLLLLVGSGGIGAAVVAIVKLPRERNSAAVMEAQGTATTATALLKEVSDEREHWRERALEAERELRELRRSGK